MSAAVWNLRHAGSPQSSGPLTAEDVVEGVRHGDWEPTDEVRGPGEADWRPLEAHPVFAEAVADLEPAARPEPPDETRLDMNPLIDVALVLLIFFILTTSYDAVRKSLDVPATQQQDEKKVPTVKREQLAQLIRVVARSKDGKPVVTVDEKEVKLPDLEAAIRTGVNSGRREMFYDAEGVAWGVHVAIMDAAKAAGVTRQLVRTRDLEKKPPEPKAEE